MPPKRKKPGKGAGKGKGKVKDPPAGSIAPAGSPPDPEPGPVQAAAEAASLPSPEKDDEMMMRDPNVASLPFPESTEPYDDVEQYFYSGFYEETRSDGDSISITSQSSDSKPKAKPVKRQERQAYQNVTHIWRDDGTGYFVDETLDAQMPAVSDYESEASRVPRAVGTNGVIDDNHDLQPETLDFGINLLDDDDLIEFLRKEFSDEFPEEVTTDACGGEEASNEHNLTFLTNNNQANNEEQLLDDGDANKGATSKERETNKSAPAESETASTSRVSAENVAWRI
jgi:hypothetical protein